MRLLLGVLVLLVSTPSLAQVRTWVSSIGVDTNPCTRTQPCRNFAAAITAVADNGEVVALDSAGFGPITIAKSVALIAPEGVHAAIAPTSGNAITVNLPAGSSVLLRNLYLNSQGADNGVDVNGGVSLLVENLVINGFAAWGIHFQGGGAFAAIDTTVRNCASTGVEVEAGQAASFDRIRLFANGDGLISATRTSVNESFAANNTGTGFLFRSGSKSAVEDSTASANGTGFAATSASTLTISRSASSSNGVGVLASGADTRVYLSETVVNGNATSATLTATAQIFTRLNNAIVENTTTNALSGSYTAQ